MKGTLFLVSCVQRKKRKERGKTILKGAFWIGGYKRKKKTYFEKQNKKV